MHKLPGLLLSVPTSQCIINPPIRLPQPHSYRIIGFPFSASPPDNAASCTRVLTKANIKDYRVGKTRVFLKYYHMDELAEALKPYPTAAIKIQTGLFVCLMGGTEEFQSFCACVMSVLWRLAPQSLTP